MRILIIEDEKEIRNSLKGSLEMEGFAVDAAEDGEQGSYLARTNDYDVIILDNTMPKKNGYEVCREIRSAQKTMPIIILSANLETDMKVDLLNAGADDYLTKPFSLDELLARIKALLRRPSVTQAEVFQIDDLVLNTNNSTVVRGKNDIYLTRKEFALLEYLLRHESQVVSRGMIMEHVWDMSIDPFSNTIDMHILSLRRKIEGKNKQKLIHTIPGRGYKISCNIIK